MKRSIRLAIVVTLGCLLPGGIAWACGPDFPNNLLDRGDEAIMTAPEARFKDELARMKLVPSRFRAVPGTNAPLATLAAELGDLRAALDGLKTPKSERERILAGHRGEREKVALFVQAPGAPAVAASSGDSFRLRLDPAIGTRITGAAPRAVSGLPGEFADYLRASTAWHQGDLPGARQAWLALLRRPAAERHYKSVWAAFMLGKSWEEENRGRAAEFFQTTRRLAGEGFADSLGLAAASLGWEARGYYLDGQLVKAMDLYLEQADAGDATALISLRFAAARALQKQYRGLAALAAHPRARRVITAYLISGGFRDGAIDVDGAVKDALLAAWEKSSSKITWMPGPKTSWHRYADPAHLWLEALESAGVRDVEAAEQIALAAYQMGQMDTTRRWLDRGQTTPLAQWLRAKLLLRDGKVEEASALLARLCHRFPPVPAGTPPPSPRRLMDSLYVQKGVEGHRIPVAEELQGELGVFRLARRQYTESLDLLLRSTYWIDAAYVAERVLTVDELKAYVDRQWPAVAADPSPPPAPPRAEAPAEPLADTGENLRYLLARRLARAQRDAEAREYYPAAWRWRHEELVAALREARNASLPPERQAKAFLAAAWITRTNGLELLGTELEPDWQTHDGDYTGDLTVSTRESLQITNKLTVDPDELRRARQHVPNPDQRYHYRFVAAALAWEAARMMPNNDDATARVLCQAGAWIKYRDPQAADVFYKALVRRCRKTALGAEADRLRWFPRIDADGRLDLGKQAIRETDEGPKREESENSDMLPYAPRDEPPR